MTKNTIKAYINPLLLRFPRNTSNTERLAINLFNFLAAGSNFANRVNNFTSKFDKIKQVAESIFFIPSDSRLEEKLILPLKHAYASLLVGNYLGSLALCGMIGEMLAIFKYDLSCPKNLREEKKQRLIFGKTFEKLGQERKIEILQAYKIIDDDCCEKFEEIRSTRNKYLHYWSKDHETIEEDTINVFCSTIEIVKSFFPQVAVKGEVVLEKLLKEYLDREAK